MDSADDHFSLKWNNFRSSLTEGFHDFLQEEMMVDVTLAAEGKFLQAHKLVLSVCSPYFKNLFNVNPCKHPIVILKDVTHNELSYVLQFMYKGEVGVKHEELPSFLKLADTLKLKGLAGVQVESDIDITKLNTSGVRKKKVSQFSDLELENVDSNVCRLKELRSSRQRKRRFLNTSKSATSKSDSTKKLRLGKSDSESKYRDSSDEDYVPEDAENDALVELFVNKSKDKQTDINEEPSSRDELFDNDDLDEGKTSADECDLSIGLFDTSADTDQAPQAFIDYGWYTKKSTRKSYIWKYFIKYQSSATCKLCGRNFRGFRPHTSIEFHLKNRHPWEYQEFAIIRERQRQVEKSRYVVFSKLFEELKRKD